MGTASSACIPVLVLLLLLAAYAHVAAGRSSRQMLVAADPARIGNTCILKGAPNSNCTFNPAIGFKEGLDTASEVDRLYQTIMAQHVLCPERKTQQQCTTDASVYCSWNHQHERCEADRYASYLLPLACPGSKAWAYLDCMRKTNAAGCKADKLCTAEHDSTCYPRFMVAEAQRSKVPAQSAAEDMALAIISGDSSVLGTCAGAQALKHFAQLCPYSNSWSSCNNKYCNYDVPPYIPTRQKQPQQQRQPQTLAAPIPGSHKGRRLHTSFGLPPRSGGLPYYGIGPAPICAVDVQKLPTILHELLNVSSGLQAAIAAADRECQATDTVQYIVRGKQAVCGYSMFRYNSGSVARAAGLPSSTPGTATALDSKANGGNRSARKADHTGAPQSQPAARMSKQQRDAKAAAVGHTPNSGSKQR